MRPDPLPLLGSGVTKAIKLGVRVKKTLITLVSKNIVAARA